MNIALIRRGYSASGGAEAYLRRLGKGLMDAGHEPVLITTADWPMDAWVSKSKVVIRSSTPDAFASAARQAAQSCDKVFSMERIGQCDVYRAGDGVHCAWQLRRRAMEPGWKSWFRVLNRKNASLLRLERETFSLNGARLVIANSVMVREEILRHFDYPADRITVIPNGFDAFPERPHDSASKIRAEYGISAMVPVALFAGSGWERKGLRFAIAAAGAMPEITLLVAGKGRWHGVLPSNVKLLGPVKDMMPLYAMADFFVAPTIYDPFSNACLEALAAGLPVITSDANGFSEIITDRVHGSIIRVGDVRALKDAFLFWVGLRGDHEVASRCRELARQFSVERNVRATLDVINHAAGP